jgi:hypothetical protein
MRAPRSHAKPNSSATRSHISSDITRSWKRNDLSGAPSADEATRLGPETASGSGDYVAASALTEAYAVGRLYHDRRLTLRGGRASGAGGQKGYREHYLALLVSDAHRQCRVIVFIDA